MNEITTRVPTWQAWIMLTMIARAFLGTTLEGRQGGIGGRPHGTIHDKLYETRISILLLFNL